MLQFVCDSCSAVKQPGEAWILGHAGEAVGVTTATREVNILSGWDAASAVHPLAVHFCSVQCKEDYIAELFRTKTPKQEVLVERAGPAEIVIERTTAAPAADKVVTKVKYRKPRQHH
jgi:hypothetical protein